MFNNGGADKIQESPKGFYHIVVNMDRTTTFVLYNVSDPACLNKTYSGGEKWVLLFIYHDTITVSI